MEDFKEKTSGRVPVHVSIIMDGNGRWARQRGEERVYGHTHGVESVRACVEAAAARIRPILMTSTTTIFAMMPMAFSHKEGPNMTQPIALTVLGGLLSATLITLFFIPIMYYIFNKGADKKKQR